MALSTSLPFAVQVTQRLPTPLHCVQAGLVAPLPRGQHGAALLGSPVACPMTTARWTPSPLPPQRVGLDRSQLQGLQTNGEGDP